MPSWGRVSTVNINTANLEGTDDDDDDDDDDDNDLEAMEVEHLE